VSVPASITPRLTVNTRVCMCVRGSKLKDKALGSRFKMIEARSFFALDAVDALLHRPRPHHDGTVLGGLLIQQQQTVSHHHHHAGAKQQHLLDNREPSVLAASHCCVFHLRESVASLL